MSKTVLEDVLSRYEEIHRSEIVPEILDEVPKYNIYALTNFRGGIGKTTLAFNLAYEVSKDYKLLCLDCCPQQNFTELLTVRQELTGKHNIHDLFLEKLLGETWGKVSDKADICVRVYNYNEEFDKSEVYLIPGSEKLFLFPSTLYTQLNQIFSYNIEENRKTGALQHNLLLLKDFISDKMAELSIDKCIIDTSPFFSGASHLAWSAAEALIIPVRVDQQSISALELTLKMLNDETSDFNTWRKRAGIKTKPKVQAVVMTHCGWNRTAAHGLDKASISFIEKAIEICTKYSECFSSENLTNHVCIFNEFHSAGKISGKMCMPLSKLVPGKFHKIGVGERVQVNQSINRYRLQLEYLSRLL